jgi:hypothetical protein
MTEKYIPPVFNMGRFNCPHCGTFAQQKWYSLIVSEKNIDKTISYTKRDEIHASLCVSCYKCSYWHGEKMIYPISSIAPLPADDMPEDVREDFNEARDVVNVSPRSAAALLRLALEKLVNGLGAEGKNLDDKIGDLVKSGLSMKIQQALDSVRVIGNNAVHPGQIDLKDDADTAIFLFESMNVIVEAMITQPKKIQEIFDKLPDSKKEAIKRRDS